MSMSKPTLRSSFIVPLLASVVAALVFVATSGVAEAKCVETGFGKYRKGGPNSGTYEGSPGDICNTIIASAKDPITTIGGGNSKMIGKLEFYNTGWRYTFANTPPGVVENFSISVAHTSGTITSFNIKATRK